MPRLPVATLERAVMAGLAALALMLGAPPPAAAATTVKTLMRHMMKDADVKKASQDYETVVQAAMMYHECPAEFADTDKRAYIEQTMNRNWSAYRAAFAKAHQKLTGKLPSDRVVVAYDKQIIDERDAAALKLGKAIRRGDERCKQLYLKRLDDYFAYKHAYEKKQGSH